jgi:hypothetical protein
VTTPAATPQPTPQPTPWLSTAEAAVRTKRHPKTVLKALRKYEATKGREGMRGAQPNGPHSCWRVHLDDVDRWTAGEAPVRRRRAA